MTQRLHGLLRVIIDHQTNEQIVQTSAAIFDAITALGFGDDEVDREAGAVAFTHSLVPYNYFDIPVDAIVSSVTSGHAESPLVDGVHKVPGVLGVLFFSQEAIFHGPGVGISDDTPTVLVSLYTDAFLDQMKRQWGGLHDVVRRGTPLDREMNLEKQLAPKILEHLKTLGITLADPKVTLFQTEINPHYGQRHDPDSTETGYNKRRFHYRAYYSIKGESGDGLSIGSHIYFTLSEKGIWVLEEDVVTDFWHP